MPILGWPSTVTPTGSCWVDEEGTLIDGDHMLGFLSRYLAQHDALLAARSVTTTMRNNGLRHYVESAGLELYETPVGDKYVSDKLISYDENRAGRSAGAAGRAHHSARQRHITGDGIRPACCVRAFLESHYATLAAFATGVGKTPQIIASAYVGNTLRFDKHNWR